MVAVVLGVSASFLMGPVRAFATEPDVVIVLCDDLGYGDLGCYGHPVIKTPVLDALAGEGLRMTQAYAASPVCSPSRAGLLTGIHPNRLGIFDWIPETDGGRMPAEDRRDRVHLRRSAPTLGRTLRRGGYQTAVFGKWHLASRLGDERQPTPRDFGFDDWLVTPNNAVPSHERPTNFRGPDGPIGGVDRYSSRFVADTACEWIRDAAPDRPLFLWVTFHEPHEPVASEPALVRKFQPLAVNGDQAEYFANVASVDAAVGRLVDGLRRHRDWGNTWFVFTSDNGPETLGRYRGADRSYGVTGGLTGRKLHTTEGGVRVPMIVRPPTGTGGQVGVADEPRRWRRGVSREVVSALDLHPTLASIAGDAEVTETRLDGVDLSGFLAGGPMPERSRPLVWVYYNALNQRRVAMRWGRYKVLATLPGVRRMANLTAASKAELSGVVPSEHRLYDLATDPGESNDLYGRFDESDALCRRLDRAYAELLADSPVW